MTEQSSQDNFQNADPQGDADMADFADQVSEIFGFDAGDEGGANPFESDVGEVQSGEEPTEPTTPSSSTGVGGDNGGEPAAQTPPASPAPSEPKEPAQPKDDSAGQQGGEPGAKQPEKSAEERLREQAEKAEIERLRARVKELESQPAPEPKADPAKKAPEGKGHGEVPAYNLQLPPQILDAVDSDEPAHRAQALNGIVNGVLGAAHKVVLDEVSKLRDSILSEVKATLTQSQSNAQAEQTAKTQQQEYFEAFPNHNKEQLMPIVARINGQMAAELPNAEWNADWIAALGARVDAYLSELGVPTESAPAPSPAPAAKTPPARPAAFTPTSTRTTTPTGEISLEDEIQDTLGFSGF